MISLVHGAVVVCHRPGSAEASELTTRKESAHWLIEKAGGGVSAVLSLDINRNVFCRASLLFFTLLLLVILLLEQFVTADKLTVSLLELIPRVGLTLLQKGVNFGLYDIAYLRNVRLLG